MREEGKTYSEILREVKVSKSSLSLWLREVGLAKEQKQAITEKRIAARLRALESIRRNKIKRVKDIKDLAKSEVPKLVKDPFWLTGLVLYWGEGAKEHAQASPVKFTNMNLEMHRVFLSWVRKYLSAPEDKIFFELFIHEKADVVTAQKYWAQNLGFSRDKLKTYFKRHNPKTKRKRIGEDYYGVLSLRILGSIPLNRKIAGWIEGVVVLLGVAN